MGSEMRIVYSLEFNKGFDSQFQDYQVWRHAWRWSESTMAVILWVL